MVFGQKINTMELKKFGCLSFGQDGILNNIRSLQQLKIPDLYKQNSKFDSLINRSILATVPTKALILKQSRVKRHKYQALTWAWLSDMIGRASKKSNRHLRPFYRTVDTSCSWHFHTLFKNEIWFIGNFPAKNKMVLWRHYTLMVLAVNIVFHKGSHHGASFKPNLYIAAIFSAAIQGLHTSHVCNILIHHSIRIFIQF